MNGQAVRIRALDEHCDELLHRPSAFIQEQFERAGIAELLELVRERHQITVDHIPLLTAARLSHLAACVRLKKYQEIERDHVKPVVCLPIARFLEIHGTVRATTQLLNFLDRLTTARTRMPIVVYGAVDRWRGAFRREDLLETLSRLKTLNKCNLQLLGPSTAELEQMFEHDKEDALPGFLKELADLGLSRIDGGASLEIHSLAASLGFSLAVSQDISCAHDAVELMGPVHAIQETRLIEERFLSDLLVIADTLLPTGKLRCWFPWSRLGRSPLHHHSLDAPFAEPLLRMTALARLVFPSDVKVRAPFSLFGKYLAYIALQFGATDLGHAALDADSASQLALHSYSHVVSERLA